MTILREEHAREIETKTAESEANIREMIEIQVTAAAWMVGGVYITDGGRGVYR